ncbi:MAG: acyl-[acyl-carrier-protein]--UDP-N-acetylglucosamine O-acyltransferase, partial [Opitutaceae bacterium]
ATVRAINKVGLERAGFTPEQIDRVKIVYRILYREGLNRSQAIEKLESHEAARSDEVCRMLDFAKKSERGLIAGA